MQYFELCGRKWSKKAENGLNVRAITAFCMTADKFAVDRNRNRADPSYGNKKNQEAGTTVGRRTVRSATVNTPPLADRTQRKQVLLPDHEERQTLVRRAFNQDAEARQQIGGVTIQR